MKKLFLTLSVALIAYVAFIFWHTGIVEQNKQFFRSKQTLTVAHTGNPAAALMYIAEQAGYFKDQGLEINFILTNSGKESAEKLASGEADLALTYQTPFVEQVMNGQNLAIFSSIHNSSTDAAIVAPPSNPIKSPSDLKWKRIGYTEGTASKYYLYSFLVNRRIDPESVIWVDMPFNNYLPALQNNTIDAAITYYPHLAKIQEAYPNLVMFRDPSYISMLLLIGKKSLPSTKGEAIQRLIKALVKAEQYSQENSAEAQNLVIKSIGHIYKPSEITKSLSSFNLELSLNNMLLNLLDQEARWVKSTSKEQKVIPTFINHIIPEYLSAERPEAVTIFKP